MLCIRWFFKSLLKVILIWNVGDDSIRRLKLALKEYDWTIDTVRSMSIVLAEIVLKNTVFIQSHCCSVAKRFQTNSNTNYFAFSGRSQEWQNNCSQVLSNILEDQTNKETFIRRHWSPEQQDKREPVILGHFQRGRHLSESWRGITKTCISWLK